MQVAIRGYDDGHARPALDDVHRAHVAHRALAPPRRGAKCAEVVTAAQERESSPHATDIERDRYVPGVASQKRTRHRAVVDEVQVAFPLGVTAGVELRGRVPALPH